MTDSNNEKFDTVEFSYKAVVRPFNSDKEYVSKESFKNYKDAFLYAKDESKFFGACEFFVIQLPDLDVDINYGVFNAN